MSEPPRSRESRVRTAILIYFPMFIAALSLLTSIYNGYLNGNFVDFIQRNTGRTEYLRTCKEVIDAYFQAKIRIGMVNGVGPQAAALAQTEAANAVAKSARSALISPTCATRRRASAIAISRRPSTRSRATPRGCRRPSSTSGTRQPTANFPR